MDFVFIDLETTGGNAQRHRITEIGLLIVRDGELVETWETLINPECSIPPSISAFTGITNDMVADAPTFADIHRELLEKLEGKVFVAQNARFDYGFIKSSFRRLDFTFTAKVLCTAKLSRRLDKGERYHNLDAIMARYGLDCEARHRALGDAKVLWDFWQAIHRCHDLEEIEQIVNKLLKKPSMPSNLSEGALDDVPESPGVYLLYGAEDALLYIGKSVDMRSRVSSHFAADHSAHREMRLSQLVRRIETIPTGGELGALLLEAQLIKQKTPIFNRQLRRHRSLNSFRLREDGSYHEVEIVSEQDVQPHLFPELYGLYRTKPDAKRALKKIATDNQLCHKLLGLEKGKGSCFAYHLGKCSGACIEEVSADEFNQQLKGILRKIRLKAWPFRGRIGIREHNLDLNKTQIHIIDNWCHLGSCESESDLHELLESHQEPQFDLDTYKILKRMFKADKIKRSQIIEL